jgi:hypothetical protein
MVSLPTTCLTTFPISVVYPLRAKKKKESQPLSSRNINRVESKYPDPESFRPDRWLDPSFPTYQEPLTRYPNFREGMSMHSFGWGRRTCLGQNIVDDEMFVFGAATLWAFEISQKVCPRTGKPVPIDTQATNSHVILEPLPYQIDMRPRSDARAGHILKGYEAVRAELKV